MQALQGLKNVILHTGAYRIQGTCSGQSCSGDVCSGSGRIEGDGLQDEDVSSNGPLFTRSIDHFQALTGKEIAFSVVPFATDHGDVVAAGAACYYVKCTSPGAQRTTDRDMLRQVKPTRLTKISIPLSFGCTNCTVL